jgi:hypothetical protein
VVRGVFTLFARLIRRWRRLLRNGAACCNREALGSSDSGLQRRDLLLLFAIGQRQPERSQSPAADLAPFAAETDVGQLLIHFSSNSAKPTPQLMLHAAEYSPLALRGLEFGELRSRRNDQRPLNAQIDRTASARLVAYDEQIVGPDSLARSGTPSGGDRSMANERRAMGGDELCDDVGAGNAAGKIFCVAVNLIWGQSLPSAFGRIVLVDRIAIFRNHAFDSGVWRNRASCQAVRCWHCGAASRTRATIARTLV